MYWLRLIRWNNLLIILLTQLLAWWCVIWPMNKLHYCYYIAPYSIAMIPGELWPDNYLLLSPFNFSLLSLSTLLIAAAGYIINDYFDIRIDTINKPDKVILERQIPRRLAIIVHSVMNAVALLFAGIVAWQAHHAELIIIQLFCTFCLWKYSTTWKRQFVIGNLVVSLLTALTIISLIFYEPELRKLLTHDLLVWQDLNVVQHVRPHSTINPVWMLLFLVFFAFLLTWMREIVKDMEDYKGDAEEGCVTMPIQWGLQKSVLFTRLIGSVSFAAITIAAAYTLYTAHSRIILSGYLSALAIAILAWLIFIGKGATKEHYHKASTYLKLIMVMGIGTLIIYRYFL